MKKLFLLLLSLCFAISFSRAQNVVFKTSSSEKERAQCLSINYKLKKDQILQYEHLLSKLNAEYNALKKTTPIEETHQRKSIRNNFINSVKQTLSSKQYALWLHDYKDFYENDCARTAYWQFVKSVSQIPKEYTRKQFSQTRSELKNACIKQMSVNMDQEKAEKYFIMIRSEHISLSPEIQHLELAKETALKFAEMRINFSNDINSIEELYPTRKERQIKIQPLKEKYHSDLKSLIGEQKYLQWMEYKRTSFDRKCLNKYGFSTNQLTEYKNIKNKEAIDILKIKRSGLELSQKKQEIEKVRNASEDQIKELLTADQYSRRQQDMQNRRK